MARLITVTGGKGGVGKTNIAVNLSLGLGSLGQKVCLFDADLGLANINILLGIHPEFDLEDVISGKKGLKEIIIRDYEGVDIIPGSSGVEKMANLSRKDISRIINSFSDLEDYDFFIIDTSSGISKNVLTFCLPSPEIVIVVTPEPTSMTDAYALLKVLSLNNYRGIIKLALNQCKGKNSASQIYNKLKSLAEDKLNTKIFPLGIVLQDEHVLEAVKKRTPFFSLFPESIASKCIRLIAKRLVKDDWEGININDFSVFWERFFDFQTGSTAVRFNDEQAEIASGDRAGPDKDLHDGAYGSNIRNLEVQETNAYLADDRPKPERVRPGQDDRKKIFYENHYENPLLQKISIRNDLPSLPHILLKLIQSCGDDSSTMANIGKIMEKDPSLCYKMLQIVNSSYYNLPQRISSIQHALSLLGIYTVRNIAMTAAVCQAFDGPQDIPSFNLKLFWWHSLKCAVLAEKLAQKIRYPRPDEAFLAGLLHDIGKLILLKHVPEKYLQILDNHDHSVSLTELEEREIGVTHAEIGSWLLDRWQLQSLINDATFYHHESPQRISNAFPLVKLIYSANVLSAITNSIQLTDLEFTSEILGIGLDEIEKLGREADGQLAEVADSFKIEIESPEDDAGFPTEKDKGIQADLMNQVRQLSFLHGTLQNLLQAHDVDAIINAARNGIHILFDLKSIVFFLYSQSENILIGTHPSVYNEDSLGEMTIPFQDDKSILVEALRSLKIVDSFSKEPSSDLSIIDEQLIRLLGGGGIACFPMQAQGHPVGVLVLGLEEKQFPSLQEEINQLRIFLDYASLALHTENVRRAQAKAILNERIATTTSMARKVAHEVNNPLSIIKNYLMILQLSLEDKGVSSQEIVIIKDEIDRVSRIIDQLSDLSKPVLKQFLPIDLNELLRNTVTLITEPLARENIHINLEFGHPIPLITSARDNLKQVFINLIKNATEALKDGGNITISTTYAEGSDKVKIRIKDDGPGIPEAISSRLFEPYTTTKGEGHSGLGLAMVHSIIGELKGEISCQTGKGQGTEFLIILPLSPKTE